MSEKIVKEYMSGKTIKEVAKSLKVSESTVYRKLKGTSKKYPINEGVFDIVSEESSYWRGFLSVRGWVRGDCISLAISDKNHLEKFQKFIGCIKNKINYKKIPTITFNSRKIVEKLKENLVKDKNYWRGVIDGAGKIFVLGCPILKLTAKKELCLEFMEYVRLLTGFTGDMCQKKSCWQFSICSVPAVKVAKELGIKKLTNEFLNWRGKEYGTVVIRGFKNIYYNGKIQTLAQWAMDLGINVKTLRSRLSMGWSIPDALTIVTMRSRSVLRSQV